MRISNIAVITGLALALTIPATATADESVDASLPAAADTSPDAPAPEAAGVDARAIDPPRLFPGHKLPGLRTLGHDVRRRVPSLVVLVDFSLGGGLGPGTHVTVLRGGDVVVDSGRPVRRRTWTLSRSTLQQLESTLEQARFRTLRLQYDAGSCPDCSSDFITYGGRTVMMRADRNPAVIPTRLSSVVSLLTRLADQPR